MAKVTVTVPQGTRDFGPEVVRKRNYVFNTIRSVFEVYGFQPLETPSMENIETLMGKYGEEGDKLIFRVLDSGVSFKRKFIEELLLGLNDFLQDKTKQQNFIDKNSKENFDLDQFSTDISKADIPAIAFYFENILSSDVSAKKYVPKLKHFISEKALRYDLTIPFARYVAMNHGQLTFPFKRYQIQPVWRADRPQKGRYREFYQCDADVVGSQSLINEVELATIYAQVFTQLGVPVSIKINSRKILAALAAACGGAEKMTDITIAIDKLDKIGLDKVKEELQQRGLDAAQIDLIEKYLSITGSNSEKIALVKALLGKYEDAEKGIAELEYLFAHFTSPSPGAVLEADFTLARGLNYYTGIIFEVKATTAQMGSIGGGGRYDDLTGLFGVPNIPGVGISFGVDRIYDVMEELQLFPAAVHTGTQVLFFNLGEAESQQAFQLLQQLRNKQVRSELFHENSKFDKQFKYAEKKNIPYIIILGSKELADKTCVIKDIRNGQQQTVSQEELLSFHFS